MAALRSGTALVGLGWILAVAIPVVAQDLPVQRAVHRDRPWSQRPFRSRPPVTTAEATEPVPAAAQEELPAGRQVDPRFVDPFADEGIRTPYLEPRHSTTDPDTELWLDEPDWELPGDAPIGPQNWVRAEALYWWVEGFSVPPLVTTSPAGTDRTVAGQLDQATTRTLFGDERLADAVRPGFRLHGGRWFDPTQTRGVEGNIFAFGTRHETFSTTSTGTPILARPFFNIEPGSEGPDAELVAFPNLLQGSIAVDGKSSFEGAEASYRAYLLCWCDYEIDGLIGWRFNRLNDELAIHDSRTAIGAGGAIALGTTVSETDRFITRNVFQGPQLGAILRKQYCDWSLELTTKVALGYTRSRYVQEGSTTVSVPVAGAAPAVAVTPSGLLVQRTNAGIFSDSEFSVLPEITLSTSYAITPASRLRLGYTVLYWSRVARAGDSIDTQLNLSQLDVGGLVGPAHPAFSARRSDLWAQGFQLGFEQEF